MVVLGVITLLMHVPGWKDTVRGGLVNNQNLIPLLITVAAVAGFVIQESRVRSAASSDQNQGAKKPSS